MSDATPNLLDVLDLEPIEANLYRANAVLDEPYALYGGQVAAQSLMAAGLTIEDDRVPHSLHGYFLRKGDSSRPTVFQVYRDRDGRSYSARRVVAIQAGEVIFNMSASFHVPESGAVEQVQQMPSTEPIDDLPRSDLRRLLSFEARFPTQPFGDRSPWPTRFWARATVEIPDDPLRHACVLAYLSDISTGVLPARDGSVKPGSSIDHALWFHRPVDMTQWTLTEYEPRFAGHGRAWYTGSIFDATGELVASIAQETLFRA